MVPDRSRNNPWQLRARYFAEALLGTMAATLLLAMMIVTVVDVVGRYVLSRPLPGAFEVTEIMLAMAIFVALPLVSIREEHVAVTLLTDRFSPKSREVHATVTALVGCALLGLIAWQLLAHGAHLASYGDVTTFLEVPKGPIAYAMSACAGLSALALFRVAVDRAVSMRARSND